MTRARWLTGGLIGAGALVVGVVCVLVLAGALAIGLVSLARARRYIARELRALAAQPPAGALYEARRRQMLELRRNGVVPDLEVLADATAADEAERAYTGKYLVATTVLIGLVGTFGGLMETLARVAPLLKGELGGNGAAGALGLIAGPLAGLHVTFGTSVVAIMVTLALGLVQGDVTLHHERLLALLQERTRHVLVPELWPTQESAAERTVRALDELRTRVVDALETGAAANAAKIASVVRVEVQRLVEQVGADTRGAAAAQTAALERVGASMTDGLLVTSKAAAGELQAAATHTRETMTTAATTAREAMTTAATTAREAMTVAALASRETIERDASAAHEAIERDARAGREAQTALATTTAALMTQAAATIAETASASAAQMRQDAERVARAVETAAAASRAEAAALAAHATTALDGAVAALGAASARTSETFTDVTSTAVAALLSATGRASETFADATSTAVAALGATGARTSEAFADSTTAAVAALGELRADLGGASRALTTAASELAGTVETLAPTLAELAPQLEALAAQVALLAARADSPEQANAVLDELARLGEDVERLVASAPAPQAES